MGDYYTIKHGSSQDPDNPNKRICWAIVFSAAGGVVAWISRVDWDALLAFLSKYMP